MDKREHSYFARNLIKSCGGVEAAARRCRLNKTSLGNAQNVNMECYLPVDVISDLECYSGNYSYSGAMYRERFMALPSGDLVGSALGLNGHVSETLQLIHKVMDDSVITPSEARDVRMALVKISQNIAEITAELSQMEQGGGA